jgi:hypothetical protein
MCTNIMERRPIIGSAREAGGSWFRVDTVNVGFDHPLHIPLEHALTIDFVSEAAGPGARVAVEMTRDSARQLVDALTAALSRGADVEEGDAAAVLAPPRPRSSASSAR